MPVRLREKKSHLATWSAGFSTVSVPILVIAAIGNRAALMTATQTYAVLALGFGLAALGVFASAAAFEAIWRDGRKGVGSAFRGLVVGLVVLSVPLVGAWKLVTYPRLFDITTDPESPPQFSSGRAERVGLPSEASVELQREAYPDILPRHYPVGAARVFDDAAAIVARRNWTVTESRKPETGDAVGRLEAVALTPLFGFRQDVVIRIVPDGEGTLVDMRSTARNGDHDLGANAERIRAFFADLDTSLQGISEEE